MVQIMAHSARTFLTPRNRNCTVAMARYLVERFVTFQEPVERRQFTECLRRPAEGD